MSKTVNGTQTRCLLDATGLEVMELSGGQIQHFFMHSAVDVAPVVVVDGGGNVVFNHMDRLGSVIGTSASGNPTAVYGYTPYGASTTGLSGTAFGYAGYRWDGETGLYHTQTRSYDPATGRFVQPDPTGYDGGRNLYAYTGGDADPLNNTDPQGTLDADPDLGGGGCVGAACTGQNITAQNIIVTGTRPLPSAPLTPGSFSGTSFNGGGSETMVVIGHKPKKASAPPPPPPPPPVMMVSATPSAPTLTAPHINVPSPEQKCTASGGTPVTYSGQASTYGTTDGFAGQRTATGEIMDPTAMTAASVLTRNSRGRLTLPLIPLRSRVNVTNTNTGSNVDVIINDDGPLEPGRIIDLSPAAMAAVNNGVADGIVPVQVVRCAK